MTALDPTPERVPTQSTAPPAEPRAASEATAKPPPPRKAASPAPEASAETAEPSSNDGPLWERICQAAAAKPALAAVLSHLTPSDVSETSIMLDCSPGFEDLARSRIEMIGELARGIAGRSIDLQITTTTPPPPPTPVPTHTESPAAADANAARTRPPEAAPDAKPAPTAQVERKPVDADAVTADPLVKEAVDLFQARLIDVLPVEDDRKSG